MQELSCILPGCVQLESTDRPKRKAAPIQSNQFCKFCTNVMVEGNNLISYYGRLRQTKIVQQVFDKMSDRTIVSSNSLIVGYCQEGHMCEARQIRESIPEKNEVAWTTMLIGYILFMHFPSSRYFRKLCVKWTRSFCGNEAKA